MPKATVLLGRIACGKSFYAEALHRKQGGVILSCDELMLTVFGHCLGSEQAATEERAMEYILKLARKLREEGTDVILDCGLFTRAIRHRVYAALEGFELTRILIRCDDRIRQARLETRNRALQDIPGPKYVLSFGRVQEIEAARYEEPGSDEYDVIIEN